mgnify:CR=1 FL=1|tara:strand:+ start:1627 stop:2256 length:630 start_codon:yes stop_codon:yes gene_type:complete
MAISTQSVNRVSISDLPSAQGIKDDDYLILQSDGISSKIQVADLKLSRANLSFYNEIADLNRVTTTNTLEINSIKQSLSATTTNISTPAGEVIPNNQSRIDQLEAQLARIEEKLTTLENTVKVNQGSLQSQVNGIKNVVDGVENEVAKISPDVARVKAELTDELSNTTTMADELKSKQKLILQGVIRNSADQNSTETKLLISQLSYNSD